MKRVVLAAAAASAMLAGCVSTANVPVKSGALSAMGGQQIARTDRPLPDFAATKSSGVAAGALFGPIGGAAMAMRAISEGNELVRLNNVEDPADRIGEALLSALASSTSATVAAQPIAVAGEEPAQITAKAAGARYIVDVRTTSWGTLYYSTDWSHYGVMYGAKLRLIDASSNAVVAEGFCFVKPEKKATEPSPTFDQLTANSAAKLKSMLSAAGDKCIDQFKTQTLHLS